MFKTFIFIPVPIIPKIAKLPNDTHEVSYDRIKDILALNDYYKNEASDLDHKLSMEDLGLRPVSEIGSHIISFETRYRSKKIKLKSKEHDQISWREEKLEDGVHLSDKIRRDFFKLQVLKFFDF